MNRGFKRGSVAIALAGLMLFPVQGAWAEDQQQLPSSEQTIQDLTNVAPTGAGPAQLEKSKKSKSEPALMYIQGRRASYYSGNWALYSQENVDFYFDWGVKSSYGYQSVGAFGFNTVQALGINRSYTSGWQHSWVASTDAGVGVVSPWGNVNVYHRTLIQRANVYGDGAWSAWQE